MGRQQRCDLFPALDNTIAHLYAHQVNCRKAFDSFTSSFLVPGVNWLEIESIASTLLVRYHQKIEAIRVDDMISVQGIPASEVIRLNLNPVDAGNEMDDLGSEGAVNNMDHRPTKRKIARSFPIFNLGFWGNDLEIGITCGLIIYDTELADDRNAVASWLKCGGMDRLIRSPGCRLAFEEWKRIQGLENQIAFPPIDPTSRNLWADLMSANLWDQEATIHGFVSHIPTNQVKWNWSVNISNNLRKVPGSFTGTRTPSIFWRSEYNTSWVPAVNKLTPPYMYETRRGRWNCFNLFQHSEGDDVPVVEDLHCRVNLLEVQHCPTHQSHPNFEKKEGITFLIEHTAFRRNLSEAGWDWITPRRDLEDDWINWAWGLKCRIKSFTAHDLRTILVPLESKRIMEAQSFVAGRQLLGGKSGLTSYPN